MPQADKSASEYVERRDMAWTICKNSVLCSFFHVIPCIPGARSLEATFSRLPVFTVHCWRKGRRDLTGFHGSDSGTGSTQLAKVQEIRLSSASGMAAVSADSDSRAGKRRQDSIFWKKQSRLALDPTSKSNVSIWDDDALSLYPGTNLVPRRERLRVNQ